MTLDLAGTWRLTALRRIEADGSVTYPFGENATGILIYTTDGKMAVQIVAACRPLMDSADPFNGDINQRAAAYSSSLAYFGTYEVEGDVVHHNIDASWYPNWSGTVQSRLSSFDGSVLTLRAPQTMSDGGSIMTEISWIRG